MGVGKWALRIVRSGAVLAACGMILMAAANAEQFNFRCSSVARNGVPISQDDGYFSLEITDTQMVLHLATKDVRWPIKDLLVTDRLISWTSMLGDESTAQIDRTTGIMSSLEEGGRPFTAKCVKQ